MSTDELKKELATFKTWRIARLAGNGTWRMYVVELSSGVRFSVERDGQLVEIWKREVGGYERVI